MKILAILDYSFNGTKCIVAGKEYDVTSARRDRISVIDENGKPHFFFSDKNMINNMNKIFNGEQLLLSVILQEN